MTTYIIFGDPSDGSITSISSSYEAAKAGDSLVANTTGTTSILNHSLSGDIYQIREIFFAFDTTGISVAAIQDATLSLWRVSRAGLTTWDAEARLHDWGATLDTGDWVAGGELGLLPLVATLDVNTASENKYYEFADVALATNISGAGATRLLLNSSRHRLGTSAPTGVETFGMSMAETAGTTQDPKLTVVTDEQSEAFDTPGVTHEFVVPAGVTELEAIHAIGAGGGGGVSTAQEAGGGGAAYARSVAVAVTPDETLYVRVGAGGGPATNGGVSWVSRNSDGSSPLVLADGGKGSASNNAGAAGTAGASTGDVTFSGGAGAAPQGGGGGRGGSGGGGAAGAGGNGSAGIQGGSPNASGGEGGAGGPGLIPGGGGGRGGDSGAHGANGDAPGGGGGGGGSSGGNAGSGANGLVVISWIEAEGGGNVFNESVAFAVGGAMTDTVTGALAPFAALHAATSLVSSVGAAEPFEADVGLDTLGTAAPAATAVQAPAVALPGAATVTAAAAVEEEGSVALVAAGAAAAGGHLTAAAALMAAVETDLTSEALAAAAHEAMATFAASAAAMAAGTGAVEAAVVWPSTADQVTTGAAAVHAAAALPGAAAQETHAVPVQLHTLAPNALVASDNLADETGNVPPVDLSDLADPDNDRFWRPVDPALPWLGHWSYPTPPGAPLTGRVVVWLRSPTGAAQDVTVAVYEDGQPTGHEQIVTVASSTPERFVLSFDPSVLDDPSGASLQVRLTGGPEA